VFNPREKLQQIQTSVIMVFVLIFAIIAAYLAQSIGEDLAYFFAVFIASLIVLLKGADMLVEGASKIAVRYGVSSIVIGATIVAFGTSLPETVVTVYSNVIGSSGISLGNIIGSNIFNLAVVIGLAAIGVPIAVKKASTAFDTKYMLAIFLVLFSLVWINLPSQSGALSLTRADGILLLALFMFYLFLSVGRAQKQHTEFMKKQIEEGIGDIEQKSVNVTKMIMLVVMGIIGTTVGGQYLVDSSIGMARLFSVSEFLIGLTVIAIGTSLPELAASLVAVIRKEQDMAIGNIIGSNVFNTGLVLGIAALIRPIEYISPMTIFTDVFVMIGISLIFFVFMLTDHTITRREGIALLVIYVLYILSSVGMIR
jgi:cation:H+ antiporter